MLARIVVIVKLWLSVHLNMKPHIITHPMVTNDKTSSILKKPLKHCQKWYNTLKYALNFKFPIITH